MAEIFPDEGLDLILGVFPKNGSNLTNTYVLLFTGASASTCPSANSVLATNGGTTPPAEASPTSYARQPLVGTSGWGSPAGDTIWSQTVRRVTGNQVSFPGAGAAYGTAINGFGLANQAATGAGSIGIFYSNFDDSTAIPSLALGDVVKVTPKFGFGG